MIRRNAFGSIWVLIILPHRACPLSVAAMEMGRLGIGEWDCVVKLIWDRGAGERSSSGGLRKVLNVDLPRGRAREN